MSDSQNEDTESTRPWVWEVVVYALGVALTLLGVLVWFMRANVEGEWVFRLSQLWDSIGLISLGLAIIAIGMTLTILRVQNTEAEKAKKATEGRDDQHSALLAAVKEITQQTKETVTETSKDVKRLLGPAIQAAQSATRSEQQGEGGPEVEPDELDELSLEGVRGGDISNLPLDTHVIDDDRLSKQVETADGVFFPVGAVPLGVIADLVAGWEADDPDSEVRWKWKSKANWSTSQLVGAYRSYSPKALAKGSRNLSGSPWFVIFRQRDNSLETFYVSRNGRAAQGQAKRTPLVKRLMGDGADARWVPLAEYSEDS